MEMYVRHPYIRVVTFPNNMFRIVVQVAQESVGPVVRTCCVQDVFVAVISQIQVGMFPCFHTLLFADIRTVVGGVPGFYVDAIVCLGRTDNFRFRLLGERAAAHRYKQSCRQ